VFEEGQPAVVRGLAGDDVAQVLLGAFPAVAALRQ